MQRLRPRRGDAGMALVFALILLLIFTMFGTAYVKYMMLEHEGTRQELQKLRGKHLGQSGIYAAIGEVQAAVMKGATPEITYRFDLPLYRTERLEDESIGRGEYAQEVTATVMDESGLVNLNHAPDAVLLALGVPKNVLDARKASDFRPFVSVDSLRSRDYMNSQEYARLDKNTLTVFTGDGDGASVNLNAASPTVLAAIFNIDDVEAGNLASKRPFTSWSDVLRKIGREPSTFRISTNGRDEMPDGLSLSSDCYRILSAGSMITPDTSRNGLQVYVEAVVRFTGDEFAIRYWTEDPVEIVYSSDTPNAAALLNESPAEVPSTDDASDSGELIEDLDDASEDAESE